MKKDLGALFAGIRHLQHIHMHPKLRALGVYRGQPPILMTLGSKDGLSQAELAEEVYLQPPTITKIIGKLERNMFIYRQPDETDQRINRVYLTQKGISVVEKLRRLFAEEERVLFGVFTKEEKQELAEYLQRITMRYQELIEKGQ